MEKAKLEISKTKKGDYVASLVFPNGKRQPVPNLKLKDDSLNGKEVEVEREKGQIKKIYYEGKEIYPATESKKAQATKQSKNKIIEQSPSQSTNIYSKAPYNFIPLNEKVVPAEEIPEFDKYCTKRYCTEERIEGRFTGYIDIEIKALTPLYIRDTLTEEEYKEKLRIEDENENKKKNKQQKFINPDFFSPGGLPRIPGSSLRGMIRTLVEIMSFGKFMFFDDARLYYRGLADKCKNLRDEYRNKIRGKSAGILYKVGFEYFIKPSKGFKQIFKSEAREIIEKNGYTYGEFKHYKVNNAYIVVSGPMQGKKRDWLIEFPDEKTDEIRVSPEDIQNYKNDKNRSDRVPDLLKLAKDEVPCFYIMYKDSKEKDKIAFGHTGFFRLAYEKTIGDHIPSELKNPDITDLAEAIFGNEKTHAGRVFFEDAYLDGKPEDALLETAIPKILSNPKPTCFQHYIEQNEENLKDHPKNLAHYNKENPIRGYKLYWHRSGLNYEAEEISFDEEEFNKLLSDFNKSKDDFNEYIIEEKNNKVKINLKKLPNELKEIIIKSVGKYETQHTLLKPINKGAVFRGRIRFENLSKVELGALLFALDLPDGLAHKLGMGKPLGLGSVKITPKLYLSDRMKRYTDLFAEWDGLNDETNRITEFKDEFEKYVLDKLRNSGAIQENINSLWNIERMQHLKAMLDFNNKPNDLETDYLPLDEFKERKVLPKPNEIKNK
jgi:CRISPR/Cas system CSM-associated protein Csm3 (group 7 of RAMP superfamily)